MSRTDHPSQPLIGRRELLALGVGAFVVAAVPLARRGRKRPLTRRSVPIMGTIAELAVSHDDVHVAQAAIDQALEELRQVDVAMSRYRSDSDVGRANRLALRESVAVQADTAEVIRSALHWAKATEGAFDPMLAAATILWDVNRRNTPPSETDVRRFAARGLYQTLELTPTTAGAWVRFLSEDGALDLGGIAKGFAVDRAADALRRNGIRHGLVNVGGDLYALGQSEDGDPWKIGVRSPTDPTKVTSSLEVSDRAVATSGDYEQGFSHHGRRYHHLLDPTTGEPKRTEAHSLTVTAPTCIDADAAATALFGLPEARAKKIAGSFEDLELV